MADPQPRAQLHIRRCFDRVAFLVVNARGEVICSFEVAPDEADDVAHVINCTAMAARVAATTAKEPI
jgi:hypothetical protein